MACQEMCDLEHKWKEYYTTASYFERCQATAGPAARRSQMLLVRECRTKQAESAHKMIVHQKECKQCGPAKRAILTFGRIAPEKPQP
jgi:hypothetical protein